MKRARGLTLPELLVLVAAACLLIGAAAGLQFPLAQRLPETHAVDEIRGYLQLARLEALRNGRDCRFLLDPATGRLAIFDGRASGSAAEPPLHERHLAGDVRFPGLPPGTAWEVTFSRMGRPTAPHGALEINQGASLERVSVFPDGLTWVERRDGTGWSAVLVTAAAGAGES